jgi:hypothetical protein
MGTGLSTVKLCFFSFQPSKRVVQTRGSACQSIFQISVFRNKIECSYIQRKWWDTFFLFSETIDKVSVLSEMVIAKVKIRS